MIILQCYQKTAIKKISVLVSIRFDGSSRVFVMIALMSTAATIHVYVQPMNAKKNVFSVLNVWFLWSSLIVRRAIERTSNPIFKIYKVIQ